MSGQGSATSPSSPLERTPVAGEETPPEEGDLLSKPKRPLSAYNMFFRDQREMLLQSLPDSRPDPKENGYHGKISFQDLAKTIAARWKDIAPSDKERYEALAASGRADYNRVVKEWKEQQKRLGKPTLIKRRRKSKTARQTVSSGSLGPKQAFPSTGSPSEKSLLSMGPTKNGVQVDPHGSLFLPFYHRSEMSPAPFQVAHGLSMPTNVSSTLHEPIPVFGNEQNQRVAADDDQTFGDMPLADFWQSSVQPISSWDNNAQSTFSMNASRMMQPLPFSQPMNTFSLPIEQQQLHPQQQQSCQTYSSIDPAFADELTEPLPIDFHQAGGERQASMEPTLDDLASRMGRDCVNQFVGLFQGSNNRGPSAADPYHIDQHHWF